MTPVIPGRAGILEAGGSEALGGAGPRGRPRAPHQDGRTGPGGGTRWIDAGFSRSPPWPGSGPWPPRATLLAQYRFLSPVRVANPLDAYPNRDWERLYRDIFRHDRTFIFLCAPNDTHNCLLRGFVKNNVMVRIEPTYGYGKATDLSGHRASPRWDPRCCQKGLVLGRRLYGDRRIKGAFVRKGFKQWVDDGFPRDPETGRGPGGPDEARLGRLGARATSRRPTRCTPGRSRTSPAPTAASRAGTPLLAQGYDPAMVDAAGGAGIRTPQVPRRHGQARGHAHRRHRTAAPT